MKHNLGGNTRTLTWVLVVAATLFPACAKLPREITAPGQQSTVSAAVPATTAPAKRINLNTATATELEKLPGVGKVLAARIVEHRNNFGPFRRAEHLIAVRGVSDKKFREMRPLLTTEQ